MAWKKVPPELKDLLEDVLAPYPAEQRFMFGSPTFFINNNMFAGAHEETIILRLSPEDRERIKAEHDEVGPFEPMKGRPMREYVALPEPITAQREVLEHWVERSFKFAAAMPPKPKKEKKSKKK